MRRSSSSLIPVSQDQIQNPEQPGIRRRLSSLSLKLHPAISSSSTYSWAFQRSKSVSSMAASSGNSIRKWWDSTWSWILSRKPVFAQDLELNEDETKIIGAQNRGSWRHVFLKIRSELRKFVRSDDNVGLPQTYRYNSFSYSKNFQG